jgi:hypothetical protein
VLESKACRGDTAGFFVCGLWFVLFALRTNALDFIWGDVSSKTDVFSGSVNRFRDNPWGQG